MEIKLQSNGKWYHGSNKRLWELRIGSTITQWQELAEAFSHKPTQLSYDDDGNITHNGIENGYLYIVDEPVVIGFDILPHPRSTMDENAEWITNKVFKLKLIKEC